MIPAPDGARARIDRLRAANPAAADLATLLSTAVRIEPTLVRQVRLLLPAADVGAELDLWTSEVLGSASPLAISFDPDCAERLRDDLAGPSFDDLRERVAAIVEAAHRHLHWSLRLEERINWLAVSGAPDADRQAEELLYAAVGELRTRSSDADPAPVARWLLSALRRIPRTVAGTEAGEVAGLSAATHLDHRFTAAPSSTTDAWMPWLLATTGVGQRSVPVRFADGRLDVGRPGSATVTLPDTVPMSLDVSWHDGDRARHRRISFRPGEVVTVAVPVDEVELETLAGDRYRLVIPRHGSRSGMPVAGFNFSPVRAALRPCLGREDLRDRVIARMREPGAEVTLSGPAGSGKTVLLGAVLDRLEADGFGVVQHFYGVRPTWDEPGLVNASLQAKREALRRPLPGVRRALVVAVRGSGVFRGVGGVGEPEALAEALRDPAIGNFQVDLLVDPTGAELRHALDDLLDRDPGGLTLVYFDGSCVMERQGQFFLLPADARPDLLQSTAVAVDSLHLQHPGELVIMLGQGPQVYAASTQVRPPRRLSGGYRALLRPSVPGDRPGFTRAVISGLATGAADLDGDGTVTVEELYRFMQMREQPAALSVDGTASVVLSRNPAVRPPVVVALDDLREVRPSEVERILAEHRGSRLIITTRGEPHGAPVDVGDPDDLERVCLAMLDRHRTALALAFDRTRDPIPFAADLVAAAGRLPGRLAAIIEWILDRPAGAARIDDVPPPLTAGYEDVWRALPRTRQRILEFVAVGRSPLTVAELLALLPSVYAVRRNTTSTPVQREADFRRLVEARLLHLDGPVDAPETLVSLSHPRVVAEDPPDGGPALLHSMHMAAFPHSDPATVLPAQLADAAYHHALYGDPKWSGRLARCGGYLDLRQRTAGVDALVDDLALLADQHDDAALIHRTVARLAAHLRAEPESFVDIVHGGLSADGNADLARTVFGDWATPALTVRAVYAVEPDRPAWTSDTPMPVLGAARWPDGSVVAVNSRIIRYHDRVGRPSPQGGPVLDHAAPVSVAPAGTGVAVAQHATVWLCEGQRSPAVSVGQSEVTCLFAEADRIAVGRTDGTATLLTLTAAGPVPHNLLGHRGLVTAIGRSGDHILTASADATVRIWSPSGETLRIYRRHHAPVVALATIGDDEVLTADEKGRLRWWNVGTCTDVGVLRGHEGPVAAIAFAADGTPVTAGADGAVVEHGLGAHADRHLRTAGPSVLALATSRVGHVAVWTADGLLTMWDPYGVKVWSRHPDGVREPVRALVFTDSDTLVVAHTGGLTAYGTGARERGGAHLGALTFATEGSVIAGTVTGAVTVDLATGRTATLTGPYPVTSVAAGGEGDVIAVDSNGDVHTASDASMDGVRRVLHGNELLDRGHFWLHTRSDELVEVTDLHPLTLAPRRVAVRSDTTAVASSVFGGTWIAAGDRHGKVTATRLDGGPETSVHQVGAGAVCALVFGRTAADCLAVGSADGSVHRYVLDERLLVGGPYPPVRIGRHRGAVTGLAVEPFQAAADEPEPQEATVVRLGRDHVASSGADGTVRLWDLLGTRQVGVVAGMSGFHAVDVLDSTVVARDDEGRLWVLDADPSHGPPDRVDLAATQVVPDLDQGAVTLKLEISTPAPVDVRAVHLTGDRPLPIVPGTRPRLTLSGRAEPIAADGSLLVPRRLRPDTPYRFVVSQELQPAAPPPDARTVTLRLTFGFPGSATERTAAFRLSPVPNPGVDLL